MTMIMMLLMMMCYLQLPAATQQVRTGSLQPHVPSTTAAVLSPRTSSQLVGLTQSADPPKIISHGHVPRGRVEHIRITEFG